MYGAYLTVGLAVPGIRMAVQARRIHPLDTALAHLVTSRGSITGRKRRMSEGETGLRVGLGMLLSGRKVGGNSCSRGSGTMGATGVDTEGPLEEPG